MFDIATTAIGSAGVFLAFTNPATGAAFTDDAGNPVGVTLMSRLSPAGQDFQRQLSTRRIEMSRRGQEVSAETIENEAAEFLAALTVSWTFDTLDGAQFPCTPTNAKAFWADSRFRSWREQANVFVASDANFMKR